jgi:CRP-like cAMP-binding protein
MGRMADPTPSDLTENRLLAALPREEVERFAGDFELVPDVPLRECVYRAGEPADHVWFPLSSVFSLLAVMDDGRALEVATIGNEGFVGLPVFLQGSYTSGHMAFCQVPGGALRISSGRFSDHVNESDALQALLHRYTLALLTQIGQSSACNRLHTLSERCARWILMTHDRVHRDAFTLTQEFLAQMLGVRRAGVNEAMQELQQGGLVTYGRGEVTVTDRAGLEAASCECYALIRDEHQRLAELGGDGGAPAA